MLEDEKILSVLIVEVILLVALLENKFAIIITFCKCNQLGDMFSALKVGADEGGREGIH